MSWYHRFMPRFVRQWWALRWARKTLERAGVPAETARTLMTGWKTWAGALTLIFAGGALITATVASGEFNLEDIAAGIAKIAAGLALIGGGLGAIGIGHKIEKATAANNK